jgi:hypothetical protein
MIAAGKLPSGFAVGTAKGTFVSVEAPSMGDLPIRATVIHLTEGPTDSWAAVFTSNKVRLYMLGFIIWFASTNKQRIYTFSFSFQDVPSRLESLVCHLTVHSRQL